MKKILLAAVSALSMSAASQNANAVFTNIADVPGCTDNLGVDAGNTSQSGTDGVGCTCYEQSCYPTMIRSTPCSGTYETQVARLLNNGYCCADYDSVASCLVDGTKSAEAIIEESGSTEQLADIYSTDPNRAFASAFFGEVNNINRSPNIGRATSAHARLDACLYYSDVDALGTGYTGWSNCTGNVVGCGTSTKNDYCNATGTNDGASGVVGAVCKDRCDCVFGYGTCENL